MVKALEPRGHTALTENVAEFILRCHYADAEAMLKANGPWYSERVNT